MDPLLDRRELLALLLAAGGAWSFAGGAFAKDGSGGSGSGSKSESGSESESESDSDDAPGGGGSGPGGGAGGGSHPEAETKPNEPEEREPRRPTAEDPAKRGDDPFGRMFRSIFGRR